MTIQTVKRVPERFLSGTLIKGALPSKQEQAAVRLTALTAAELRRMGFDVDCNISLRGCNSRLGLSASVPVKNEPGEAMGFLAIEEVRKTQVLP